MRALLIACCLLGLAACGSEGPESITVAAAVAKNAPDQPFSVKGVLFRKGSGPVLLCDHLVEASPPKCGGPSVKPDNPAEGEMFTQPPDDYYTPESEGGVRWIRGYVIFGSVDEGTITWSFLGE